MGDITSSMAGNYNLTVEYDDATPRKLYSYPAVVVTVSPFPD
jgi:hypothetical protein